MVVKLFKNSLFKKLFFRYFISKKELSRMQISFVFFVLISIILVVGSLAINFKSHKVITAIILAVGFLGISIGFGIRWFTPSGNYTSSTGPGSWPPAINVCPDYLSLLTLNGVKVCVDPLGVSVSKDGISPLKKWTGGANTGTDFIFDLYLNQSGQARVDALCAQCTLKGLTWEGVYDGNACMNKEPPVPLA